MRRPSPNVRNSSQSSLSLPRFRRLPRLERAISQLRTGTLHPDDSMPFIHRSPSRRLPNIPRLPVSQLKSAHTESSLTPRFPLKSDRGKEAGPQRILLQSLNSVREKEKNESPKALQSMQFKDRFLDTEKTKDGIEQDSPIGNLIFRLEHEEKPISRKEAELKRLAFERRIWVQHYKKSKSALSKVQEWMLALHGLLDSSHSGVIPGQLLVRELLTLGLSHSPEDIIKTILSIYRKTDIKQLSLTLEDMLELSKVNRETNKILNFLSSLIRKSNGGKLGHTFHAPSPSGSAWKEEFHSLNDYLIQLRFIWKRISGPDSVVCPIEHVASALVDYQLFPNVLEAKKALKVTKKAVSYTDFEGLFSKGMFIGSLLTLATRLAAQTGDTISSKMVITHYQRRLLLAGIAGLRGSPDYENGLATLRAMEKYEQGLNLQG